MINQQTKEQEAMAALNDCFSNIQASGTTLNNAMKALQSAAQLMNAALKEKDAKIKELEAQVPKVVEEKKA